MILSSNEIRKYINDTDKSLIQPFAEDQLQGASYDVRLSGNLAVLKNTGSIIDPTSDSDINPYEQITIDGNGFVLCPGCFVLVGLAEKICLPKNVIAHIRPRTRFTRSGILISDQHCNPTYEGILQIGLFNAGANSLLLKKGIKIAQLVFEELSSVPEDSKLYMNKEDAAYKNEADFKGSDFTTTKPPKEGQDFYNEIIESLR